MSLFKCKPTFRGDSLKVSRKLKVRERMEQQECNGYLCAAFNRCHIRGKVGSVDQKGATIAAGHTASQASASGPEVALTWPCSLLGYEPPSHSAHNPPTNPQTNQTTIQPPTSPTIGHHSVHCCLLARWERGGKWRQKAPRKSTLVWPGTDVNCGQKKAGF